MLTPPPTYLELNKRPVCTYDKVEGIVDCLESYKTLADQNDKDKLNIRKWIEENK